MEYVTGPQFKVELINDGVSGVNVITWAVAPFTVVVRELELNVGFIHTKHMFYKSTVKLVYIGGLDGFCVGMAHQRRYFIPVSVKSEVLIVN